MPDSVDYDTDFFLWTQDQASRLRAAASSRSSVGSNVGVDWKNVAEEIESLGRSDKREVYSRLDLIYSHLLKLAFFPASNPRAKWTETVRRERLEVERLFEDSPSLRRFVQPWMEGASRTVGKIVADTLAGYGEEQAASDLTTSGGRQIERRVLDETFIPHPRDAAPTSGSA